MASVGLQYLFPTDFYYPKPTQSKTISEERKTGSLHEQIALVQMHQQLQEDVTARTLHRYAASNGKIVEISTRYSTSKSLVPALQRRPDMDQMFFAHDSRET